MKRIVGNLWLQLIVGLMVGAFGVIVTFPLAVLLSIKYGGFMFGGGDHSPITFGAAAIFFVLTLTLPILVWFYLDRQGSLRTAGARVRTSTFLLFLALPLWVYLGSQVVARIQTASQEYHAIRDRCHIKDGLNRETIRDRTYEVECRDGIPNGPTKIYNAQGVLVFEGTNVDGQLDGGGTTYDDDGNVHSLTTYQAGEPQGVEVFYGPYGSTDLYVIHEGDKTQWIYRQIPEKFYNVANDLDLESQRIICKHQGTELVRDYRFHCQDGLVDGEFVREGHVSFRVTMTHGVPNGIYEKFVDDRLDSHLEFKDGRLDGTVQAFYPDGALEYEGQYRDGRQEGIFRRFDSQGNLESEVVFKEGRLVQINQFPALPRP